MSHNLLQSKVHQLCRIASFIVLSGSINLLLSHTSSANNPEEEINPKVEQAFSNLRKIFNKYLSAVPEVKRRAYESIEIIQEESAVPLRVIKLLEQQNRGLAQDLLEKATYIVEKEKENAKLEAEKETLKIEHSRSTSLNTIFSQERSFYYESQIAAAEQEITQLKQENQFLRKKKQSLETRNEFLWGKNQSLEEDKKLLQNTLNQKDSKISKIPLIYKERYDNGLLHGTLFGAGTGAFVMWIISKNIVNLKYCKWLSRHI